MTAVPHEDLRAMLEAFDALIDASERYQAFVEAQLAAFEREGAGPPAVDTWRRQHGYVSSFVDLLDETVLERLRELVDRTAVMETARRGGFV